MTFASLDFTSPTNTLPSPPTVSPTPSFGSESSSSPHHREWALSPPPPPPPPPSQSSSFDQANKHRHHRHHNQSHDFVIKSGFAPPSSASSSPIRLKEQKNKGQRVSLYPTVTVHRVIHYKDYTPKEIQDTWYRKHELKSMRTIYRDLLCNLCGSSNTNSPSNGKNSNGVVGTIMAYHNNRNHRRCQQQNNDGSWILDAINGDSLRGLEGKTTEGQNRKSQVRRVARDAVMWEQNRQRRLGYHDDDLLADLYFECSESAQVTAYLMGLKDEKDAAMVDHSSSSTKMRWNNQHRPEDESSRRYHFHHRYHQDQDDGMEVEILAEVLVPKSKLHKTSSLSKVPRFSFSSRSSSSNVIEDDDAMTNAENIIPTSPIQTKQRRSNVHNNERSHYHHHNHHNNMKSLISYSVCR
mmetsp:Transcript_31013/g.74921  ORF Transcript_31013/g.74921 Transcript_31013/m.74921 type:complete len:409 (+) Transcript_31013:59-1285(+)